MDEISMLNNIYVFWLILSIPSWPMLIGLISGNAIPADLLHSSGEFAARFLIFAMMLTPLTLLFPHSGLLKWLIRRRRAIGVAAFAYAMLHTALYIIDMRLLKDILAEILALGIWTGWAAFLIFIPLAITSNTISVRKLGMAWKLLHRWVYLAALLTLIHWIFVHNNLVPALIHFIPLVALEIYRLIKQQRRFKVNAV